MVPQSVHGRIFASAILLAGFLAYRPTVEAATPSVVLSSEIQIPANAPTGTDQPLAIAVVINGQVVFGNPVFLPGVI